ncbi:unnamed protein product [Rotaria magnacalcarata]|uniref:Aromatic-L-amino-acid decarboxylase n=2 Tax=Rotaria magnacalcarata TaxID=392030 RepID=A0A815JMV3_9BILA|nr:unnamed protein product [Rotaria magnacalcarata]CAF1384483.1 unnamed protein product [Rotaria magnacalcarata]CAF3895036.1 unnamed protein product [Rotaria magnacalcarata]CAF3992644.1 unnamed protein product [Rotaria magnacalcarata]
MDPDALVSCGAMMLRFVADYWRSLEARPIVANVQPGYLRQLLPTEAPEQPEPFQSIINDLESTIMVGVTHWHSPGFHAFFPTAASYPAICADILSGGIACIGFSWIASPACTELEVIVMDWLAKAMNLPEFFLSTGNGGGIIQGTASEATIVALLAARSRIFTEKKAEDSTLTLGRLLDRLVVYCSDQAHSSVDKGALIVGCQIRKISSGPDCVMRGEQLEAAIAEDRENGLIPFFIVATLGTTPTCAFDDLMSVGRVCEREHIWMHVDAAYAGNAFICPEYRHLLNGIEYAESFDFNPHKWMLVNFDCSAMYIKDRTHFIDAFNVDPLYLQHEYQSSTPDYRHWQIPLGRRFRSLKLWFVFRSFGLDGLRKYIRKHIHLAEYFIALISRDTRFEIVFPAPQLGLVCFRLKNGSNALNKRLLDALRNDKRIYLVPAEVKGKYILRFAVCSSLAEEEHIQSSWHVIDEVATQLLSS